MASKITVRSTTKEDLNDVIAMIQVLKLFFIFKLIPAVFMLFVHLLW